MPFYDYRCDKCERKFEVLHGMSGKPAGLACEFCGSSELQRIFHPVGLMRSGGMIESPPSSTGGACASCSSGSCASCH